MSCQPSAAESLLRDWDTDQKKINQTLDQCFKVVKQSETRNGRNNVSAPAPVAAEEPLNGTLHAEVDDQINGHASPRTDPAWLAAHVPLLAQARDAAKGGRILEAQTALHAVLEARGMQLDDLAEHSSALGVDPGGIEERAQIVRGALEEIANDAGWMVSSSSDPRVMYRHRKGSPVHSLKLENIFEAPMEHLLALAAEYDLQATWSPVMRESVILHAELPWLTYFYGAMWTPFVVFDTAVKAEGFDLGEEDRSLMICLRDMTAAEVATHGPLPPGEAKRRRGGVGVGTCFRLEALPPTADGRPRTKGTIVAHLEPRLPYVPGFLVNFILKIAAPFVFAAIRKVLRTLFQDPEGIFPRRMAEKPEVYERCQLRKEQLLKHFYGIGG